MIDAISTSYVTLELPVQWGNMDATKHVNNSVYLRWIESARILMFEKMHGGGFEFKKIVPILAWQDCKYIFLVTYPYQVVIMFDVIELMEDRVVCEGKIYSKKHQRIVAIFKSLLMAYGMQEMKKQAFPESWRKALTDFYGDGLLK